MKSTNSHQSFSATKEDFKISWKLFKENWKAFLNGEKLYQTLTYLLVSNSDFDINRNKFGPYSIRKAESKLNELAIYYLDIDQYLLFKMIPDDIQTVHNKWHSGTGSEEIAALLSLQFGCKIKSGHNGDLPLVV